MKFQSGICDEMENDWGVKFLLSNPKPARKAQAEFDQIIRKTVTGYMLHTIAASGTHSNIVALQLACDYRVDLCLLALGTYVGGDEFLQELSTSMYDPSSCISVPKYPENASKRCFQQTVPFPYYVPGGIDDDKLLDLEQRCLRALHKKVIMMRLLGTPYRALLVEYILGGNGATLTHRFLKQLGVLCKEHSIAVVADEVLTGGRVGSKMAMTPDMPKEFQEVVMYITMGKFVQCALVLKKVPKKPTHHAQKLRGTSTNQECGGAYAIWQAVWEAKRRGDLETRRDEVLTAMSLIDKPDLYWGLGLLIFCIFRRSQTTSALKNRLLPMMTVGVRVRKMTCKRSKFTPQSVSAMLAETVNEWLNVQDSAYQGSLRTCFLSLTTDFLFCHGKSKVEEPGSNEIDYLRLRPDDVLDFVGEEKAAVLAAELRELKRRQGATTASKMTPISFAREALYQACTRASMDGSKPKLAKKKRKFQSRTEFTFVRCELFGSLKKMKGSAPELTFYS